MSIREAREYFQTVKKQLEETSPAQFGLPEKIQLECVWAEKRISLFSLLGRYLYCVVMDRMEQDDPETMFRVCEQRIRSCFYGKKLPNNILPPKLILIAGQ